MRLSLRAIVLTEIKGYLDFSLVRQKRPGRSRLETTCKNKISALLASDASESRGERLSDEVTQNSTVTKSPESDFTVYDLPGSSMRKLEARIDNQVQVVYDL
jgi:hypothetical protein